MQLDNGGSDHCANHDGDQQHENDLVSRKTAAASWRGDSACTVTTSPGVTTDCGDAYWAAALASLFASFAWFLAS